MKYDRLHTYKKLEQKNIDYLLKGNLTIKVYGMLDKTKSQVFRGEKD